MDPLDPRCEELSHPSKANFGISLFILCGILVSYLPQHIRIIRQRSSYGLSPYFVLLGEVSGTCAFANILTLPQSTADLACCKDISGFACFAGLLGMAQVGTQWACFSIIVLLFLIFFPRPKDVEASGVPDPKAPSLKTALLVGALCLVHAVVTFILSTYFIILHPSGLQAWANILGILSTILAAIQYFPQIYTTFRLKAVGSLSIPMMCIQTPGSFVWAASLAARLGSSGWSAWGIYLVTGCLQGTLLIIAIYFELVARKQRREAEAQSTESNTASEQTPLINGSH